MKRSFKVMLGLALFCVSGVVSYYSMPERHESDLLLTNVEALANNESSIYDYRIKISCACWSGMNFRGMAILECERYVWQIPMIRQNCSKRACPSGSSC